MEALESLRSEHRMIAGVLDALEAHATRLEHDGSMKASKLRKFTAFQYERACFGRINYADVRVFGAALAVSDSNSEGA